MSAIRVSKFSDRPVVATAASSSVRKLPVETWSQNDTYGLAEWAMQLQLKNWEKSSKVMVRQVGDASLKAKSSLNFWTRGLLHIEVLPITLAHDAFAMLSDSTALKVALGNIFVAGGLVFGTLLMPQVPAGHPDVNKTEECLLPTSTFIYTGSARRRSMTKSCTLGPHEVLLNFDLNMRTAWYDRLNVWILPWFVRAVEAGTSIFTMDLINGHYLGYRKATRDQRVFKDADEGYTSLSTRTCAYTAGAGKRIA
ncbi:hypothetical protein DFS33DRAFT_1275685 [Desarmillaria ectypa]|nr:hypothetical protein DFS33DRAFT_1275685 [Desarmillaria ectypa]